MQIWGYEQTNWGCLVACGRYQHLNNGFDNLFQLKMTERKMWSPEVTYHLFRRIGLLSSMWGKTTKNLRSRNGSGVILPIYSTRICLAPKEQGNSVESVGITSSIQASREINNGQRNKLTSYLNCRMSMEIGGRPFREKCLGEPTII